MHKPPGFGFTFELTSLPIMDPQPATRRRFTIPPEEQIFRLQLRVARRADELARKSPTGGSAVRDRETWRRAEGELFGDWTGQATRAFRRLAVRG